MRSQSTWPYLHVVLPKADTFLSKARRLIGCWNGSPCATGWRPPCERLSWPGGQRLQPAFLRFSAASRTPGSAPLLGGHEQLEAHAASWRLGAGELRPASGLPLAPASVRRSEFGRRIPTLAIPSPVPDTLDQPAAPRLGAPLKGARHSAPRRNARAVLESLWP